MKETRYREPKKVLSEDKEYVATVEIWVVNSVLAVILPQWQ